MDVLKNLASALGERKQELNISLAVQIAEEGDKAAVQQLIQGLSHKSKSFRHDCIKTLYEIAELNPALISFHTEVFISLLQDKDNRLQWGAMTTLSAIADESHSSLFANLTAILAASDNGSVITKDHCIRILVKLAALNKYEESIMPLLLQQIATAPNNQLPSYAEQALPLINGTSHSPHFKTILNERLPSIEPESKQKRVLKILKKLNSPK